MYHYLVIIRKAPTLLALLCKHRLYGFIPRSSNGSMSRIGNIFLIKHSCLQLWGRSDHITGLLEEEEEGPDYNW